MALRVLGDTGTGTWAGVADIRSLAGELGVPVVNASLGALDEVQVVTDAIARHPRHAVRGRRRQ